MPDVFVLSVWDSVKTIQTKLIRIYTFVNYN